MTKQLLTFNQTIDQYTSNGESKFQLQYVDYENGQWTIPVLLTPKRAARVKNDASIKSVTIFYRGQMIIINPE